MSDVEAVRQGPVNIALPWYDGGCSVVPIKTDGTKRPTIYWEALQTERLTRPQVDNYWRSGQLGVAVICGKVSGNLEMTEIEGGWTDSDNMELISLHCERLGVMDIWENLLHRGYAEWTPAGGIHVLYRIKDGEVPGNTKLAMTGDKIPKTKAETRGEAGYVIVAPTGGQCHPSGEAWITVAGTPGLIPYLTMAERDAIHAAITAALDESPPPPPPPARREAILPRTGDRPGDDFNKRETWENILEPHGWRVSEHRGQETLWVRPDKARRDGHSASTGYANDADRMYVWSTSAGLPTEVPLTKFFVYAQLNHGGDFTVATRTLSSQGYGAKREVAPMEDWATRPSREIVTLADSPSSGREVASQGEVPQKVAVKYTRSDSGNADHMIELLQDRHRYSPQRKKWLIFTDGIWEVDHQGVLLKEAIDQEYQRLYREAEAANDEKALKFYLGCLSDSRINATAERMRGRQDIYVRPEQFDKTPQVLNLAHSTMDLVSKDVWEQRPTDLLTKKMAVNYDPNADHPVFTGFLDRIMPDAEEQDSFQRAVGYSLCAKPVERTLVVFHGPAGTGKSKLVELFTSLFGSYGTTAADSLFRSKRDQPTGASNDLNDLKGARLASVSELDAHIRMDEALIKRLTGFDTLTSRGLYEENTSWRPQCVIWLATNHLPKISSDDGAIFDRLKIFTLDQQIPHEERDPFLLDKLLEESDGIFNWMLEGLRKYQENGLARSTRQTETLKAYRTEQDPVTQFIDTMIHEGRLSIGDDKDDMVSKTVVYINFKQFCADEGIAPLGKMRFNRRMEDLGYREHKRGILYWKGLRLDPSEAGIMGTMR